ncbi:MAG TPA: hypothetical protein ENI11_04240 [Actinobacteria bacterium]|nr:hypothetical protein [Actinomycetota bacterium]
MPLIPMFGSSALFSAIVLLTAFVFLGILFVLLGIELQWRLRGILLLILLVIGSAVFGFILVSSISFMGSMPQQVELENVSARAGFDVFLPKSLPAGMKFKKAHVISGPPEFKEVTILYSGGGDNLSLMESKTLGIEPGLMFEPAEPGVKSEKIRIKGQPGRIFIDTGGFTYLSVQLDTVSIQLDTSLGKDAAIKVARSLMKQKR